MGARPSVVGTTKKHRERAADAVSVSWKIPFPPRAWIFNRQRYLATKFFISNVLVNAGCVSVSVGPASTTSFFTWKDLTDKSVHSGKIWDDRSRKPHPLSSGMQSGVDSRQLHGKRLASYAARPRKIWTSAGELGRRTDRPLNRMYWAQLPLYTTIYYRHRSFKVHFIRRLIVIGNVFGARPNKATVLGTGQERDALAFYLIWLILPNEVK